LNRYIPAAAAFGGMCIGKNNDDNDDDDNVDNVDNVDDDNVDDS
jgi:hypothetical protein